MVVGLSSKPGDGAAADLAVVARRVSAARGRVLVFSVACFPPINHEICLFGSTGTLGLVVLVWLLVNFVESFLRQLKNN